MRENVRVDVNTTIRVDSTLEAGAVTEVLTVTADPPPLQSDRADTGRIIQGEQIAAMPLGFGRNFQGMVATVPGASRPFRPHSEFFNSQDSLSSNVNGQSRLANNVQIEGVDNNHRTGLLTVLIPSAEALETVSVTTSNYDAEFGRAGGAVTNVTLKSGTNQFKGSGFYFGNTEGTIATNPFVDRTLPKERQKAQTAYHQGGFTLGGPIIRNRLFFFGDYIRTSDDLGRINRYTIPTEAMRNGDFSASSVPIFDPLTGDPATGAGRTQFPGNRIPADRISPIARQILANVPAAEHRRRGARAGQLPGRDGARAPHRRVRREVQLPAVAEGSAVGPLQLPAADRVRARQLRRQRLRRPLPGRLRRHRRQQDAERGRQLDADADQHVRDGRALRRQHLPQRRAQRRQRPEHRRRSRHPGRQPRHLHERDDDHQPAGLLEPDRRLLGLDAVEPR